MSRREWFSVVVSGFLVVFGVVLLFIATQTAGRLAGILGVLYGSFTLVTTTVYSRRRRRRDAAPVVHDPRTPTE